MSILRPFEEAIDKDSPNKNIAPLTTQLDSEEKICVGVFEEKAGNGGENAKIGQKPQKSGFLKELTDQKTPHDVPGSWFKGPF